MPREPIPSVVVEAAGGPAEGAALIVRTATGPEASVFAHASGDALLSQPLTVDRYGGVRGWLEPGRYVVEPQAPGIVVTGTSFELGQRGEPQALPLLDGWRDLDNYARSTYRESGMRAVSLAGVVEALAGASPFFARLPEGFRPARPVQLPTLLGRATDAGTEVLPTSIVALPDGRLRGPAASFRWLLLNARFDRDQA